MVKKPNFYIAGAPKCGTTAISEYLRCHPQIFISTPKEIHFFSKDFPAYQFVEDLQEYLNIFKSAKENQIAVGEASVWYLYSKVALKNIYDFDKKSKIVVMLRNPVDMFISLHAQMTYNLYETERDIEVAWKLQNLRLEGKHIPKTCLQPEMLQYRQICMLGEQVERLLDIFPREQVHFIILDEFKKCPQVVYKKLLRFLSVADDNRSSFPIFNARKIHRFSNLGKLIENPPLGLPCILNAIRKKYGIELGVTARMIRRLNQKKIRKQKINPKFQEKLSSEFFLDINNLSLLLGKKLWEL